MNEIATATGMEADDTSRALGLYGDWPTRV
jgi:hypothetical protein